MKEHDGNRQLQEHGVEPAVGWKEPDQGTYESEGLYRTLFDAMDLGRISQDADGRIISANAAAERILGVTLDEMLEAYRATREAGLRKVRLGNLGVFARGEEAMARLVAEVGPEGI